MGTTLDVTSTISIQSGNACCVSSMASSALVPETGTTSKAEVRDTGKSTVNISQLSTSSPQHQTCCWKDLALKSLHAQGLNEQNSLAILNSLRESSQKQYTVYINRFMTFCNFESLTDFHPTETVVINCLQSLYDSGLSYSAINTAGSAIKTFLELLNYPVTFTSKFSRFKGQVNPDS